MNLIEADPMTLVRQATSTASLYFDDCKKILEDSGMDFDIKDVIAMAHIAALDFHTAMSGKILEKAADSIASNI